MTERIGKILLEERSMLFASQCTCVGVYAHAQIHVSRWQKSKMYLVQPSAQHIIHFYNIFTG